MKTFNKKSKLILLSLIISTFLFPTSVFAQSVTEPIYFYNEHQISNEIYSTDIEPYADIINWRYTVMGGNLYRRQYNYTKQKWIGEWELC